MRGVGGIFFDYQDGQDSFFLAEGLDFEQLLISQNNNDTWIETDKGERLAILKKVEASQIGAEDFSTLNPGTIAPESLALADSLASSQDLASLSLNSAQLVSLL